ncbi:hypothetical protein [Streptomyces sp. NPDC057579]|uniref:hypothetical protein n=1 Tax=Streptomyces sp. NPDC057579 TaxID=3346172 RepID=UPI0036AA78CC
MGEETYRRRGAPSSARKEVASLAVIELLANGAGCYLSDPRLDYNCVDTTVVSSEPHRYALPRSDLQAKASSSELKVRRLKDGDYSFQLEADDYNELRRLRIIPVKFVLMILPAGVDVPSIQVEQQSLNGFPATWMCNCALVTVARESSVITSAVVTQ